MTAIAATPLETLAQQIARQQTELEALRREYENRQTSLTDLNRQKEALQAQLRQVDAEIQATTQGRHSGSSPAPKPTRQAESGAPKLKPKQGKRKAGPKQPTSLRKNALPALLLDIVTKASSPLTVKQLTSKVVRRKFPTTSSNFAAIVKNKTYELVKRGLLQRASGQRGFVLATSAAQGPADKVPPAARTSQKDGAVIAKKAPSAMSNGKKQQQPLRIVLTDLLARSRRPMTARELADQVLSNGYQTKSKKFIEVMWVALSQMDNIVNVAGKGYVLKK